MHLPHISARGHCHSGAKGDNVLALQPPHCTAQGISTNSLQLSVQVSVPGCKLQQLRKNDQTVHPSIACKLFSSAADLHFSE